MKKLTQIFVVLTVLLLSACGGEEGFEPQMLDSDPAPSEETVPNADPGPNADPIQDSSHADTENNNQAQPRPSNQDNADNSRSNQQSDRGWTSQRKSFELNECIRTLQAQFGRHLNIAKIASFCSCALNVLIENHTYGEALNLTPAEEEAVSQQIGKRCASRVSLSSVQESNFIYYR